ncbi:papain-like cysteine protease family protein [Pelagibaculum spongiae]|uniref:Peptidase C39-like domain-containing protein n=1 Tax=Pelagibaculum spongiae TaxID=2080658 RepID=A0A2V1GVJ9_9GAMM|nr:papain-like cysteine protease family protein [Pelagibaculum spongiae]PVZ63562.1 hypothetical protein DC094_20995 [Pelagibaculum spongiae]
MRTGIFGWLFNKHTKASTRHYPKQHPEEAKADDVCYEVPYLHQAHVNMCYDASLAMLLAFHEIPAVIDLVHNPRGTFQGTDYDRQVSFLEGGQKVWTSAGFFLGGINRERLLEILKQKGPLLVTGDFVRLFLHKRAGHAILLKGIYGNQVVLHDPWHGEDRYKSIDWFTSLLDRDFGFLYVGSQFSRSNIFSDIEQASRSAA